MKKTALIAILAATLATQAMAESTASVDDVLTGDTRLACEAILCLSSSQRPSECTNSLKKYYSLRAKKWHQTVTKRKNFLKLCPQSNSVDVEKMASSKGACDRTFFFSKSGLQRCLDKNQ